MDRERYCTTKGSDQPVPTADLGYRGSPIARATVNSGCLARGQLARLADVLNATRMRPLTVMLKINLRKTIWEAQRQADRVKEGTYDEAANFKTANKWFRLKIPEQILGSRERFWAAYRGT
ncbi:hypothetical protein OPT61_g2608 [Boeremia exigua]|uniref:Uncharacterized protein n=1 Tax=Boeremia exigua TaxID=749465 RepID=A0ACC2IL94_9PLEO|nr:hypothetical protein OPT61_g2608 [Boeremia exigua]